MSRDPAPATGPEVEDDRPSRIVDRVAELARIYARAFLSQGAGLVGLAWCLDQNLPWVALGLAVLVLIDQVIFLRGRAALEGIAGLQAGLDAWCLLVSFADLLILFAALFRATGLRDAGGASVSDPLNCLAFAVATLARLDLGLVPVGGGGRLVAALEALMGDVALVVGLAGAIRFALRRLPGVTPS